jgi:polyketide cyclase/dehydrase/lipid transport protein
MPSFSHSIDVPKPPAEVFPWLLEEDKVPRWTGDLSSYAQLGPLGEGSKVRQVLAIGGNHITLELEVTRYDPPHGAESRFSTNGVDVVNTYMVEPAGAGSRVTQELDARASSFTARMLIPVLRGRLEKKVTDDLERLRGVLGG